MRTKLTNTVIAKLAVPEGKQSVKLFDTDVGGLGIRKMASGCRRCATSPNEGTKPQIEDGIFENLCAE